MPKKGEERSFDASKERLFQASLQAVSEHGYSINHTDRDAGTVSFNTGRSMRSWAGQDMTVTVLPEGVDRTKVVVGGSLATRGMPFGGGSQLGAWGEKKKVAREFFTTLEQVLPQTAEPPSSSQAGGSPAEELSRLADLHEKGVLSEEEFQAAKTKLLS